MSRIVASVESLRVAFGQAPYQVLGLRDVSLTLRAGQITGIVGESGSGKSTLALAMIGLLPVAARISSGAIRIGDQDIVGLPEKQLRDYRGAKVSMVFQDPMTALSPARTIGGHLMDAQHRDRAQGRAVLRARAVEVLRKVGVPDPASQLDRHPHQLSGGMRQRVAIAMALLGRPDLLIADEITTALDVTLEAQILHLLRDLRAELDGAIVFISHNLGAVAEICDHVAVFYAGEKIKEGPVREIFHNPRHPYTRALRDCDPARIETTTGDLPSIAGETPVVRVPPSACVFAPRCPRAEDLCHQRLPDWVPLDEDRGARCHFAAEGQ